MVGKSPKRFDVPEIVQPFMFVWFQEFHWFVIVVGRIGPIVCLVFYWL